PMPMPSVYQPLLDHLVAVKGHEAILTFREIEAILDAALPLTAITSGGYWSSASNSHVRAWHAMGWAAHFNRRRELAIFTRDAEEWRMPSGHKTRGLPSRYQPLIDYLAAATGDEMTLTYREVATLIGGLLPGTAVLSTNWWTGQRHAHVQAWRAMGWRAHGSAANRRVRFTRDAEEGMG
ncbi:MAG: hypothetical protein M3008_04380, partial [Chloroflexota bacterium]|nr:hypothetical protein [Chloroflexota bacterium]